MSSQTYYKVILGDHYDVHMVTTVEEAKKAIRDMEFRLVIVDISLPGEEDGIALLKYLSQAVTPCLPAFVISAHAFPQYRENALESGAVAFFTKPIMSGVLLEALKKHIQA